MSRPTPAFTFHAQLPLLPVMDINFQSPDGELIGNTFTLSRVLTLTDIVMITMRGDVTVRQTHSIWEDFRSACMWCAAPTESHV